MRLVFVTGMAYHHQDIMHILACVTRCLCMRPTPPTTYPHYTAQAKSTTLGGWYVKSHGNEVMSECALRQAAGPDTLREVRAIAVHFFCK